MSRGLRRIAQTNALPLRFGRGDNWKKKLMTGRQKAIAFFITLGSCLVAVAIALNVSWIMLHWRQAVPLVVGIILFALIIAGLVIYTIFLVLEICRNEQHASFIIAVTEELKTPMASIRLYLETLQTRPMGEE